MNWQGVRRSLKKGIMCASSWGRSIIWGLGARCLRDGSAGFPGSLLIFNPALLRIAPSVHSGMPQILFRHILGVRTVPDIYIAGEGLVS